MRGFQFKSAVSQAAAETAAARASARTSAGRPRLRAPRSLLRLGPAFVIAVLILGLLPATAMATDPQTITFDPLTDRRLDESPFDLSATASSGLDVVFTSETTPVCTVAGVSVTLHAHGLCAIDADQAGDGTWGPADTVSQSFIVTQGNQSITFDALSDRRLDETPFTISATASSTLPVVFTSETTPVCTVAGTSVTLHSAGLCTIDADQWGDDNWISATTVPQTFTVTQGNQFITFDALSGRRLDETPFGLTASASSGLAVTYSSETTLVCTVVGAVVALHTAGLCTIDAHQAGDGNWTSAAQVQRSFTVTQGNQSITFGALSGRSLDESPFTVSATASSNLAVVFTSETTSVCTVAGTTVTLHGVGLCTIDANQSGNANWTSAAQVQHSFTVGQGDQTITFGALSGRTLDDSPFGISATASSGLSVTFTSESTSVCTVVGTTVTLHAFGSCIIDADQAGNGNWDSAPRVQHTFAVSKGNQTIAFAALGNRDLDQSPFDVSATASSGLTVTFTSETLPVCTVVGVTVTLHTVGSCIIDADQAGNGNWNQAPQVSRTFGVGPGSQTITFGALSGRRLDQTPFSISATASSGLTVIFSSEDTSVCTVAGTSVALHSAGLCIIDADQPGNGLWNAAATVPQSFTVAKGNQTVSFSSTQPSGAKVNGSTYTPAGTATSGLAVAFTIDSSSISVCSIAAGVVSFIGAGTCRVNADQAGDTDWNPATQVHQSFTVAAGDQTILFTSTAPVGAAVEGSTYSPTATATSGLTVAFTIDASASGVCSIAGTVVSFIGAGTCVIDAHQSGNPNWSAAPQVQQSFAVGKGTPIIDITSTAPVTAVVNGSPYSVTATSPSPVAFVFTIDSSASAFCSIAGNVVSFTAVGTCVIDANQAADANWNAAVQVQQSFDVDKGTPVITFTSTAPVSAVVGGNTYTVTATSPSPVTIVFSIDSSATAFCSIAAGVVSFTASGTCKVNANQAGDANWHAAAQVQQSFPVTVGNVPGRPTGVTGVGLDSAAQITWIAPVDNGGSPITSYTVTSAGGSGAHHCNPVWVYGAPLTCKVTGLANHTNYTFTITATNGAGTSQPSVASANVLPRVGATYHALTPSRILDSAVNLGTIHGAIHANVGTTFQVTGWAPSDPLTNVPSTASAVTGVLSVSSPTAAGWLSLTPVADNAPLTSTINVPKNDARATGVTVPLNPNGSGSMGITYGGVASSNTVQVAFDVTGYFELGTAGATYFATSSTRIFDTRVAKLSPSGTVTKLTAGTPMCFQVTGRTEVYIPSSAVAVTGTFTVSAQTKPGSLSMTPESTPVPTTASLYFPLKDDRATGVTYKLGSGSQGHLCVTYNAAAGAKTDAIFDVTGFFVNSISGAMYVPVTPNRIMDTRLRRGITAGLMHVRVGYTFPVANKGGVPASGAVAVTGTLTVAGQTYAGYLSLGDRVNTTVSTLNFPYGDNRATGVTVPLSSSGALALVYSSGRTTATTHAIFDVTGYFVQ
jgi:hypothetical protein